MIFQRARFRFSFRLLGFLPLFFFGCQTVHYWEINELGNLLWMCNIGNLLLAFGLLFGKRLPVRASVIWTLPGLAVWLIYVVMSWGIFFTSTLAHLGGLAVGLLALARIRMDRLSWIYAFLWYLVVQQISRFFTAPPLNVNLSQRIYEGWENTFGSYGEFWVVVTMVTLITLWISGAILRRIWPQMSLNEGSGNALDGGVL